MKEPKNQTPKRWSARKKTEIIVRLMHGEKIDDISRETGVEIGRLEDWKNEAIGNVEKGFRRRVNDPIHTELSQAKRQIGELSMAIELLKERIKKQGPLVLRRS
ncbi:MAG: IS3 family transposase [Chlamydiia bacterium]|nr:IS3 family transposase [Chlamydiia bacterium]